MHIESKTENILQNRAIISFKGIHRFLKSITCDLNLFINYTLLIKITRITVFEKCFPHTIKCYKNHSSYRSLYNIATQDHLIFDL